MSDQNGTSLIINDFPCGLIMADKKLNITLWNKGMEALTGISSSEALNSNISTVRFYDLKLNEKELLDMRDCFKGNKTGLSKTAFIEKPDGKLILIFINARIISSENEKLLIIVVTDISKEISCNMQNIPVTVVAAKDALMRIVGRNEKILELYKMIELASDSMANVLITGESGTGKELVADAIHELSSRNKKPFIKVNCSSLPETLLESELFGHVKGSFTGAYRDKKGKFEEAQGGTVFLDEIGEISPMIQVKLLRVIQEKIIERIGDNKPIKVDMRIIAATNKNLRELVSHGLFREDLFYRLSVFPIHTPPLRERKNDIPLLVAHFIEKFNIQTGKHIKDMNEDAYRIIMGYCWPGNVRELENSVEHAFVLCNKKMIDVYDLPQDIRIVSLRQGLCKNIDSTDTQAYFIPGTLPADETVYFRSITHDQLKNALMNNNYKRSETAKQLGVSRVALWQKMKKLGMQK